jgi:hypothetical protein
MNEESTVLRRKVVIKGVTGELEIPNGRDPFQNAWLTLTLGYGLTFLDSRVRGKVMGGKYSGDVIVQHDELGWCARDSDDFLFPILEWGSESIERFRKLFQQGEYIWNHRFLIKPPEDFDKLDFSSPAVPDYVLRPNIICLFRMQAAAKHEEAFSVVRINPEVFENRKFEVPNYSNKKTRFAVDGFQSHEQLLTDRDVFTHVLGHELGHAINEDHIMVLKGDEQCKVNPNADRCYGTTPEEVRNIMGGGTKITAINVKPWIDSLEMIVGGDPMHCNIVMLTDPKVQPLPPRKIPIAKAKTGFGAKR